MVPRAGDQPAACQDASCLLQQARTSQRRRVAAAAERRERLLERACGIRDRMAEESGDSGVADYHVVLVPYTSAQLEAPDRSAQDRFRRNLTELVSASFLQPEQPSDHSGPLEDLPAPATLQEQPLFQQGCTACRGNCCHQGDDHAFLSIATIRRYRAVHPDASAEEIINAYLDRLPGRSMERSCVFHGEQGCQLPTAMRSDICNRYLCPSLHQIRATLAGQSPPGFLVVSQQQELFHQIIACKVEGSQP